ncbi:hypothetical protein VTO73DRAFT_9313 [Trametes versicolor]
MRRSRRRDEGHVRHRHKLEPVAWRARHGSSYEPFEEDGACGMNYNRAVYVNNESRLYQSEKVLWLTYRRSNDLIQEQLNRIHKHPYIHPTAAGGQQGT